MRWKKSHSKIETNDEFGLAMQRKDSCRATFYYIRKPGENQTRKSISSELANLEVQWNGETRCIRTLIKLLRMQRWKKLDFSSVEIWWIDGWSNGEARCLLTVSVSDTFLSWLQ